MAKTKTDAFYRDLLATVFPLVIQAFMLALVSATDAVMLGLVDQTSMSSASLGGQVQFVLNLFVLGLTGGLSILTAQYWGKGEHKVVERLITGTLLYMLLFCGLNLMFQSVNHTVLDGVFCTGGDSAFDMYGNIGAMWCFSVPLGFLAAFFFKAHPVLVYCVVNLDEIVKIPAVYLRYRKYIWLRDLTRPQS